MDLPTIESICLSILRLYSRPKVSCGWLHCEQQACAASFYGCSIYNWVHLLVAFYAVQSWTCVLKYCLSWGSTWSVRFLSGLWHCVTVWFLLTVCYSLVSLPGLHLLKHFSLPSWTFCYGVVSYLMAVFDHISFCILWWCYRLLVISFFYNLSYTPENSPALGLKLILRSDTHTRTHHQHCAPWAWFVHNSAQVYRLHHHSLKFRFLLNKWKQLTWLICKLGEPACWALLRK